MNESKGRRDRSRARPETTETSNAQATRPRGFVRSKTGAQAVLHPASAEGAKVGARRASQGACRSLARRESPSAYPSVIRGGAAAAAHLLRAWLAHLPGGQSRTAGRRNRKGRLRRSVNRLSPAGRLACWACEAERRAAAGRLWKLCMQQQDIRSVPLSCFEEVE